MPSHQAPRSLNRIIQIFELLADAQVGLTLTELATRVEAPKSSLLNLLPSLVESGHLASAEGRYAIGPRLFALAGKLAARRSFMAFARPRMEALAQELEETISIAILELTIDVAVYVDSIDSKFAINYTIPIGQIRPLYASVAGKVLLAFQSDDYIARYLDRVTLVPRTARTLTDKDALRDEIARVREQGYATTREESSEGVSGFAAPIFGSDGRLLAALGVGGPTERILRKASRCIKAVKREAEAVSELMGKPVAT